DDGLDRERSVARALDAHGRDGSLVAARIPVLEALAGRSRPEGLTGGARSLRERELLRARGRAVDEDLKDGSAGAAPEGRVAHQRVAAALLLRRAGDLALRRVDARLRILHRERLAQNGLLPDARTLHGTVEVHTWMARGSHHEHGPGAREREAVGSNRTVE